MTRLPRAVAPALAVVLCLFAPGAIAQSALTGDALTIACGPRGSLEKPAMPLTIAGSLAPAKGVYAPWHRLVINAGSDAGLQAGQEFFVRRLVASRETLERGHKPVYAIATVGWIRIDEAEPSRSIASVVHECDGITPGDYLEPFAVPAVPTPLAEGKADYVDSARVLFGLERGLIGGSGSLMVVDRGSNDGIQPGQRFTIFRPSEAGPNVIIARAVALVVQPDTTTIRIHDMRDAVVAGDGAAPHR